MIVIIYLIIGVSIIMILDRLCDKWVGDMTRPEVEKIPTPVDLIPGLGVYKFFKLRNEIKKRK